MQASRHRAASMCRRVPTGCPRILPAHFAATADEAAIFARLPTRYTRHGRFWLIAQTLHFITRPNAALRHQLQRERAALGFRGHHPVLALHVRKGDACTHRGECRGLSAFMPEVRRVANLYGIRAVFLATPSPEVLAETSHFPEFTWLFRNVTVSTSNAQQRVVRIEDRLLQRRIRAVDEWRSAMVDIYLMAECQALVGAMSSSAARLALALMAGGSNGCPKPYLSVDINWCFSFFKGGPNVIRRGIELLPEPWSKPGNADVRSAIGNQLLRHEGSNYKDEAARKVLASGMTC